MRGVFRLVFSFAGKIFRQQSKGQSRGNDDVDLGVNTVEIISREIVVSVRHAHRAQLIFLYLGFYTVLYSPQGASAQCQQDFRFC